MDLIEQAIFTSAETERMAGYQVVAHSDGVCEEDVRALAVWGPSHDSLLEQDPEFVSLNFHGLPSGAYCISRTSAAGCEYSGRGGQRIYTQCLVVPPTLLARFANNPFAVLRAAMAAGAMEVCDSVPAQLPPITLTGRAPVVDQTLLSRLAVHPGAESIAAMVQAAMNHTSLAIAGEPGGAPLIAGLLSCLPPSCRCQFSFATGLRYSSRRPFRVIAVNDDPAAKRWLAAQPQVTLLDLDAQTPRRVAPLDGWAQLVERTLASGRVSFLANQLARHPDLALDDLSALGLQLIEEFEATAFRGGTAHSVPSPDLAPAEPPCAAAAEHAGPLAAADGGLQQAHAAHRQFAKSQAASLPQTESLRPSKCLDPQSPAVLQKLEYLDDLVFEAMGGQAAAMQELTAAWPTLRQQLGNELLAESREQYLRYALHLWEHCVDDDPVRDPNRAVQALDVLCVLFDEV